MAALRSTTLAVRVWCALACFVAAAGCASRGDELVPATADQDPRLPQLTLEVAGHRRALHLETFGAPTNPVLLVFHGGEGSDFRAMLPLAELADRYFVVMWDARGSGLSERITAAEVSEASYAEEVHRVKEHFSPGVPVTYVGYSSGGFHGAIALAHHPEDFTELVLIEPDAFDAATRATTALDVPSTARWVHQYLWQNEVLTPDDHALADYKLMTVSRPALEQLSCDPSHPSRYPMWRLGAMVQLYSARTFANADYRAAAAAFAGRVRIIATRCGPLAATFQRQHVLPLFAHADVIELGDGIDHLTLFDRGRVGVLAASRDFLAAYGKAAP